MEIIIIDNCSKPGDPGFEDKYGFYDLLHTLSEMYRCPKCNAFLEYKDDEYTTLICPDCNFEKPNPKR
ncbi:MAG: hypothetical protein PHR47_01875 [Candidatus Pacebacteria bacterium]|nr:hypothetical protein [Candidatus Paceibacterota bacterium]